MTKRCAARATGRVAFRVAAAAIVAAASYLCPATGAVDAAPPSGAQRHEEPARPPESARAGRSPGSPARAAPPSGAQRHEEPARPPESARAGRSPGSPARAAPLRIVAIGASNTHGWYVGNRGAYPALLEALLKAKGIDARVANAGVPFDTTAGMLQRIDSDVPKGTHIVILQPGANDRRFLMTREQRAANIAAMERRLLNRSITVIVYDDDIPLRYYALDFIHLTSEGHAMIAAALLPRVMAAIGRALDGQPPGARPGQP